MATLLSMPSPEKDLASILDQRRTAIRVAELARLLGFRQSAIYKMCEDARIPHYRIGASIRFDPHFTAAWLRMHQVGELKVA